MLTFAVVNIVAALGATCREVRAGRRIAFVLVHLSEDWTERSLQRFEEGETQPRHLGSVVDAYSIAFSVSLPEILRRTAKRLDAAAAPEKVEEALGGVAQSSRRARASSAPRPAARPKRRSA